MRHLAAIAIVALILLAFNYAMRKDAEQLCSNDATAYEGCHQ